MTIPIVIITVIAIDFMLDKLGYQRLGPMDTAMSYEEGGRNHNIGGYFEVKKLDFLQFKQLIIDRAVNKIRKLNQIQVKRLGFTLWKDAGVEMGKNQVMKVERKITTDQQCIEY